MNAERLLKHYERIADAPDAIARLRRFILDLAIRGKLLPQEPEDEPASELLKRIAKEKARLMKAGEIKRHEPPVAINQGEFPWASPNGWTLTRLATISRRIHYGYTASSDSVLKDIRMLRITDIQENGVDWETVPGCVIDPQSVDQYQLREGDILIARTGGTIGKTLLVGVVPVVAVFASYLIRVQGTSNVFDQFLKLFFESSLYWTQLHYGARGTGQPNVNGQTLGKLILPLPPLAEQHRIVAKVDELMGLCDRLETARTEREKTRDKLAAASLARLNAPNTETFEADARFALDALPALTARPDQIKALRQTILNLAVRGKLVPQDPKDEPASELLKRIGAQANHTDFEAMHKPPHGWAWVLVEDCFAVSGGIQKTPARTPKTNAFPYVGVGNVYRGRLDFTNVNKFELAAGELERFCLKPQDILVVEGNGSANEIGRCAIWNSEIENCVHQNHIIRCRPEISQLTAYAALYLNSPDGTAEMRRLAITSAGLFSLSVGKIRKIPFPLPPLSEQHRIVAKVDELMAICDKLETSLASADETRHRLIDALLAEALTPANALERQAAE